MALNRGEIVTEVETITGRTDKTTQIQTYVMWALKRITRAHMWKELDTFDKTTMNTTSAADTAALPTNCRVILSMVLEDGTNSRKLNEVLPRYYDKIVSDPSQYATGKPSWYIREGTQVRFFSYPDAAYDVWIRYSKWASDVTTDGQTPQLTNKDDLIVTATALELSYSIGDTNDIKMWENNYNRKLAEAVREDMLDPDWSPVARGYDSGAEGVSIGEYWTNPFISEVD